MPAQRKQRFRQLRPYVDHAALSLLGAVGIAALLTLGSLWYVLRPATQPTHSAAEAKSFAVASDGDESLIATQWPAPAASTPAPVHDYTIPPITGGLAPVIARIPTQENVVFLGIDDGANKQAFELQLMQQDNIHASLFLANRFINNNPGFFNDFVAEGSLIEDHTVDHYLLSNLTYDQQKQEICSMADMELKQYGRRPVLFRPPGGDYNTDTQRAAAACGMKAVVLWDAKANGGSMQYQLGHSLRPGDVVLMHFRPEFAQDMQAFVNAENAAGLHTDLLENWTGN